MPKIAYYDPNANWSLIPSHMHDGVQRYVMHGDAVGDFLVAILANDFMEAAGRADSMNLDALKGWAIFLYNHVPSNCRGSRERVLEWQAGGGIAGGMQ